MRPSELLWLHPLKRGVDLQPRARKLRGHRIDGTTATQPPIIRRVRRRRHRNRIAAASRRANR